MARQAFTDVPPDHPLYNEIQRGAFYGIIKGFPDGTFKPDQPVTRAETAAIAVRAFERNLIFSVVTAGIAIAIPLIRERGR